MAAWRQEDIISPEKSFSTAATGRSSMASRPPAKHKVHRKVVTCCTAKKSICKYFTALYILLFFCIKTALN